MKILLTQPIVNLIERLPPLFPDLGLGYIASSLTDVHDVKILDWGMQGGISGFEAILREFHPELCGIKIFTKDVGAAIGTIEIIRSILPHCIIVLGGPHVSCSEPDELLSSFPYFDYAFNGEVEHVFPEFIQKLEQNKDVSGIAGLIWKEGNTVLWNKHTFIKEIDTLLDPAWELINPQKYSGDAYEQKKGYTSAPIITTRGCPGQCTFCSAWRVNGKAIRKRSPQRVVNEIEELYNNFNVRFFHIMDNCFTSSIEHLVEFCNEIIKKKLSIKWDCNSFERLDNLTGNNLTLMYQAGCRRLLMGVESASDVTRQTINKKVNFSAYKTVINEANRSGIQVVAFFMLGFPGETKKAMKETIQRAYALSADEVTFSQCFPLPGSAIYEEWKKQHDIDKNDWSKYKLATSPYPVSELSSKQVNKLVRKASIGARLRKHNRMLGNIWVRFFI
ncbi:MAG: radical SAM protein [Candidatus Electrothrix sp. AUS1_2]|nr:radical SAM protein [Candidatus Electrothrix sp. AUS1_2]